MGRKRTGQWKYLYLFIAGVIIILLCSCASFKNMERKLEAMGHLIRGDELLEKGKVEQSLAEYNKAFALSERPQLSDKTLFNLGLIYAHDEYSGKNYETSRVYFRRLLDEFPTSPMAEQARIWVAVLTRLEKAQKAARKDPETRGAKLLNNAAYDHLRRGEMLLTEEKFDESLGENQTVLVLAPKGPPGDSALFNTALLFAHYKYSKKDYKKSIAYFEKLIKEFPDSNLREQARIWIDVLESIEKAKAVDIEIEKKRKELIR